MARNAVLLLVITSKFFPLCAYCAGREISDTPLPTPQKKHFHAEMMIVEKSYAPNTFFSPCGLSLLTLPLVTKRKMKPSAGERFFSLATNPGGHVVHLAGFVAEPALCGCSLAPFSRPAVKEAPPGFQVPFLTLLKFFQFSSLATV